MSTQTKLLSSATVLSTLSDNDKIVAVTEAGNTGLVSKATLKSEMGLSSMRSANRIESQWMRVAKIGSGTGIIFVSSVFYETAPEPIIILVGCSHFAEYSFVKVFGGKNALQFAKVRLIKPSWTEPGYVDVLNTSLPKPNDVADVAAFGNSVSAITPVVVTDNTIGDRGFSIEVELGGGRNYLIYNPLKAVKAERRAA